MTCSLCAAVGIAAIYIALAKRDEGKCGGSCAEKLLCEDGFTRDMKGPIEYEQSCKLWHDIVNAWEQSSPDNRGALNEPGKFAGKVFPDWFTFASTMYRGGSPEENIGKEPIEEATGEGKRFSDDYLLHENMGEGIKLWELAAEATFYGNYPSPDNLDGEVIDAAATYNGAKVEAPSRLTGDCVRNSLHSVDEIHKLQDKSNNRTTPNILGEKVLSDHMPTFFDITFGELSFTGMEYNMLAKFNIPNGYYNTKPPRRTHLWHFILNIADAWEPKTLMDVNTEWHAELEEGNLLGHVYEQVWDLRKRAAESGFWKQADANRFVSDSARQKALWKTLIDCQKSDPLPDVIFFVEFGLLNFGKREERLKPFIDLGYTVVVASARRHGKDRVVQWRDSALILVKKDILVEEEVFPLWSDDVACDDIVCDAMKCVPGECVLSRELSDLEQVSNRNRGKPMAGVKLKLEKDGIAEEGILFVLHAEKRSTEFVVKRIVEEVKKYKGTGGDLSKLPVVIAGDLNGVLRNRGQEKIVSFMETLQGSLTTTGQYASRSYTIEHWRTIFPPAVAKEHGLSTKMAISVKKNGTAIATGVIDGEHCSVNPLCCFSEAVRHSCPSTWRLCIIEVNICSDGDRVLITESRYTGPNTWEHVPVKESTRYDVQKM